jgi:hypothetical protein
MVNVPDGKIIRLYVDDEPFTMDRANLLKYERALDMKRGVYEREVVWETPAGKQVRIKLTRMVSFAERHVAAISYEVTVLNAKAPVVIVSELTNHAAINESASNDPMALGAAPPTEDDPRLAKGFKEQVLVHERTGAHGPARRHGLSHAQQPALDGLRDRPRPPDRECHHDPQRRGGSSRRGDVFRLGGTGQADPDHQVSDVSHVAVGDAGRASRAGRPNARPCDAARLRCAAG